jgi:DNA-binding ferritin-like protein
MEIQVIAPQPVENSLDSSREFGILLLKAESIIHMVHWYVLNYDAHKILGSLYEDLDGLFDKLQEEIIGVCRQTNTTLPRVNAVVLDLDHILQYRDENSNILETYYKVYNILTELLTSLEFNNFLTQAKTGIHNTVDEIISRLNKTNYLLSLVKL